MVSCQMFKVSQVSRLCSHGSECCRELCTKLAPVGQQLVDAFGIPDHLVAAPIAADWETFNISDNRGMHDLHIT